MTWVLRTLAVLLGCFAASFAFYVLGSRAVQPSGVWGIAKMLLQAASVVLFVRAAVWLWSGPAFWRVAYRRAEVCAVLPLLAGWYASGYYVSWTDPQFATKLLICGVIFAVLVYVRVRLRAAHQIRAKK